MFWTVVNDRLEKALSSGHEYRVRQCGSGPSVNLFQENQRTGIIEQRHRCADRGEARKIADRWDRHEAMAKGPW